MSRFPITHFAINTDDLPASRAFYQRLFGWEFRPWGPPGFEQIFVNGDLVGALQSRRALAPELVLNAFECTITVDDAQGCCDAAVEANGSVLLPPTEIPTVGTVAFVRDPSGVVFGVMQYA